MPRAVTAIVDRRTLLNGSFNWTRQGVLYNNENVVVWDGAELTESFQAQFEQLWTAFR